MDYREWGSHAQGVYPTQHNSRMGIERVKQEEETDRRIMQESSKKSGENDQWHEWDEGHVHKAQLVPR